MIINVFKAGAKENLMANKAADIGQNIVIPLITGIIAMFTAGKGIHRIFVEKK